MRISVATRQFVQQADNRTAKETPKQREREGEKPSKLARNQSEVETTTGGKLTTQQQQQQQQRVGEEKLQWKQYSVRRRGGTVAD